MENNSMQNPVSKIPPEVWAMIADNVISGTDLASLCIAVPVCANLCYPKRVEWMFEQVLPLVLTNNKELSIADILACRSVCKKWFYAVDALVENTVHNEYFSCENVNPNINNSHHYKAALLDIASFDRKKMLVMLKEATDHPRNPIVGKCVKMEVTSANRQGGIDLVYEFHDKFGQYINFLHLSFNGKTDPTTLLNIFVPILRSLPNLKKLVVEKFMINLVKPFTTQRIKAVKRQLDKFNDCTVASKNFRDGLPKLESLNLVINGLCERTFKHVLINMFSGEYLKSLTIQELNIAQGSNLMLFNLVYLNIKIETNEQLESVLFLNCPKVEKLCLNLDKVKNINCEFIFLVLHEFRCTLTHVELSLPNFLETETFIVNGQSLIGDSRLMVFFESENLQLPNLRTLSLYGFRPPSFNFIAGFSSLEYMNLNFDREILWEQFLDGLYHPYVNNSEILDVIQKLKPTWSGLNENRPAMRASNLWNIFPIMQSLKVRKFLGHESCDYIKAWQYNRND